MSLLIHADESGDLGWTFDKPYGKGGSSRYLAILAVCSDEANNHRIERAIRDLYRTSKWDPHREKKWIHAPAKARDHIVRAAIRLCADHQTISYHAIVVNKERVQAHLRADPNKLYNYMLRLMLIDEMAKHERVTFKPDDRSVKVASGNSLHDYLQTTLWYENQVETQLETLRGDSRYCKSLQFADMLAGAVGSSFEFGDHKYLDQLGPCLNLRRLYFPPERVTTIHG